MFFSTTIAMACNKEYKSTQEEVIITSYMDDSLEMINDSRKELARIGYSQELMDELFGNENFYFPINLKKLDMVTYIVDLLIENEQFQEKDKNLLLRLAQEASTIYMNERIKSTSIISQN
tara:strand:+ start:19558 stop:19917 length:360 start_codon:yes stop_codon:yes gene_type:complete